MKKIDYVCKHCKQNTVVADAYMEWDVDGQKWDLAVVFEKGGYCSMCDGETTVEAVEVNLQKNPTMHDLKISDAHARGYSDGRYEGVENNVFDAPALRVAYTSGYERGVSDYCFYEVTNEPT